MRFTHNPFLASVILLLCSNLIYTVATSITTPSINAAEGPENTPESNPFDTTNINGRVSNLFGSSFFESTTIPFACIFIQIWIDYVA